jgi:hypothetical protein
MLKPPRKRTTGLQIEHVQEDSVEAQILANIEAMRCDLGEQMGEIRSGVDMAKGQIRDMSTQLFGGGGGDEHGRIPRLESSVRLHEGRLQVLEEAHVRYGVYGRFFSVIGGVLAGSAGVLLEWLGRVVFGH